MSDLDRNPKDKFSHDMAHIMLMYTVMTLSFQTDRSGQTVQTLFRLLPGSTLFAIPFAPSDKIPLCLNFRYIIANIFGVPKFRNFTVLLHNRQDKNGIG